MLDYFSGSRLDIWVKDETAGHFNITLGTRLEDTMLGRITKP